MKVKMLKDKFGKLSLTVSTSDVKGTGEGTGDALGRVLLNGI